MAKKAKSANYDFKQKAPEHPMGHGSYANLPDQPIFATFRQDSASYRDGILNNPACGVDMISKVGENGREKYGHA
jgi:hypothetical protein